ncbi:MAG: SRPBCC domain-containing protein [Hyphomonadaceae bacterium]
MSAVDLSPIVKVIEVRRSAADAFRLFTEETSTWWPLATHSRGRTAEGEIAEAMTIEPRVGGRVYETWTNGETKDWGEVLAFEPGKRFAMTWNIQAGTEVEVRFEALAPDQCRVTLTHSKWELIDPELAAKRGAYEGGWGAVFEKAFGDYAGRN